MRKLLFIFILSCFSVSALAKTPDYKTAFKNETGCFMLYNLNQNKITASYATMPAHCDERIPPNSSFKIPLSVMAFDQHLITQKTVFKWNGTAYPDTAWNQDQTPKTWFSDSVLWVSQTLTPQLGMAKIKSYLKKFNYGNQDFSGEPGQDDALTTAWLSSSLKISANEQLAFMKALVSEKLPASKSAIENTKSNMFLKTLGNGWQLYGKTGAGMRLIKQGAHEVLAKGLEDGWFIGYAQKNQQIYVIILNLSDQKMASGAVPAGIRAQKIVEGFLADVLA